MAARSDIERVVAASVEFTDDVVLEGLRLYRAAGADTIRAGLAGESLTDKLDTLGRLLDLVRTVSAEPEAAPAPRRSTADKSPTET